MKVETLEHEHIQHQLDPTVTERIHCHYILRDCQLVIPSSTASASSKTCAPSNATATTKSLYCTTYGTIARCPLLPARLDLRLRCPLPPSSRPCPRLASPDMLVVLGMHHGGVLRRRCQVHCDPHARCQPVRSSQDRRRCRRPSLSSLLSPEWHRPSLSVLVVA